MKKPLTKFIRSLSMTVVLCLTSGAALGEEYRPGDTFRDCEGCPEMVVVPSGSYMMGSPWSEEDRDTGEGPVHRVTIGKPFAVGVYEVTRGQWSAFVSETGYSTGDMCWVYEGGEWRKRSRRSWRNPGYSQSDTHPVVCASWKEAWSYALWLFRRTGKKYRLLSESEWEYVARAGTQGRYHFGRAITPHEANYNKLNGGTTPVGSYPANSFGLYDVHGNVWEWTQDCWNDGYAGAPADGGVWESGDCERRVMRGGSWYLEPRHLRSALRIGIVSAYRVDDVGFRVARTLD